MTIKIYVNWYDQEVLTEAEYNERAKEMAEQLRSSDYGFSEFLEQHYSHRELFEANEEERATILENWAEECLNDAYDELGYNEEVLEV